MFLELAEALDCPVCREGCGLVTFVRASEARRVLEGHLGCPLCEVEYPIVRGVVRLDPAGPSAAGPAATEPPPPAHPDPAPSVGEGSDAETSLKLAALLDLAGRDGSLVLLGPGLAGHGPRILELGGRLELIAWLADPVEIAWRWAPDALAAGLNPLGGAEPASWPVRSGSLHGIVLAGSAPDFLSEAARCLRPAGRLVLLSPPEAASTTLDGLGVHELASDPQTWVGERR